MLFINFQTRSTVGGGIAGDSGSVFQQKRKLFLSSHQSLTDASEECGLGAGTVGEVDEWAALAETAQCVHEGLGEEGCRQHAVMLLMAGTWAPSQWTR